jgi:N-methylhydantoinase B
MEGLIEKFGAGLVRAAMAGYLDYGESVARRALKTLPKGVFSATDVLDDGRVLKVAIEITDSHFLVDLDDCPDQDSGPYNLSFDGSLTAVELLFKCITSPSTVCNGGTFRPVRLKCRQRSIFNAQRPAAQGMYYEAFIRLFDVLWKALAPAIPTMTSAGHFGSICATIIGGLHPETGRHYNFIEPELGGWGAGQGIDGSSAQFSAFHGDTYICPVEINEARNGLLVDQICLNPLPGGEGTYRGGRGVQIDYRPLARNAWVTVAFTRSRTPPWGLNGGRDGSVNYIEVLRKNGAIERYGSASGMELGLGDVVRITTGNGGGYGDPRLRPIEAVMRDVENELLTRDRADEVYDLSRRMYLTGDAI